jgi:Protein of unknown function (DUF2490)
MRINLSLFIGLSLTSFTTLAQPSGTGAWNIINTKINLSSKWSVFNELQMRSQLFYQNQYYYEIKGGASYSINKNFSFLVGLGKYKTFSDGGNFKNPVTANEFRLWEQVTMNHYLERIKFEHRYRAEQRWFKDGTYRNRFRYRLSAVVPINNKKMGPKTFYLSSFDEVFFTNTSPYFERNRFFAGAGYQIDKHFTIQPGYLYQFDYKNNVGSGKRFFQLMLMIELYAHKNPHEKIPGNID